jgi:glycolate oxidase iron-sulfur subunit
MMPNIDAATMRVLHAVGIGARWAPGARCCGALSFHLDAQAEALAQMRANVDAWWPLVHAGKVEAIVMNASGCGAMVIEYAHHLRHDPAYAQRAAYIVSLVKDIAQILAPHAAMLHPRLKPGQRVVFHPPCTLQHWQHLRPLSEQLLVDLGFELLPFAETHLCCGSAGTYSVLNPAIALPLRDRKLLAIAQAQPEIILSSNIGCIGHLASGAKIPVRHWIEAVDARL